ncbi:hypothetical protein NLG97_g1627 [Lecanicillium saksenae]|uniref:Uncharacterized protein n=1 Tax=Lecanicillium saksenae TaxID=468837 RepID=A0ACC1R547_9HYPO|nr:hypothetical protein NLG97_g1627 [Lecanicillium saksenae]
MLFIQSLAVFASLASATSFQAWTGGDCNGSAGDVVYVATHGTCENVYGRHSWESNGDNVRGFYYSGGNCQGYSTYFTGGDGTCNNINTGGPVISMCVVGANESGCGL